MKVRRNTERPVDAVLHAGMLCVTPRLAAQIVDDGT
jgi:hypothetical protein